MKALVLAAGYATRLYPLTLDRPKALLEVGGPMLDRVVDRLLPMGVDGVIVDEREVHAALRGVRRAGRA